MRLYISFIASIFISLQGIALASVEISNPRAIMDSSIVIKSNQRPDFRARLSPDGKYIMFPQMIDSVDEITKFFLQNIDTGIEIEIPIELPRGYGSVFSQVNFFNLKGDKLALFTVDEQQDTASSGTANRTSEIKIFDIPSQTLISTGITGQFVMGQFDYTDKQLVISINDSLVKITDINDFKPGESISSGWIHSCSPKSPYAVIFVRPRSSSGGPGLELLNLKTNTKTELPVHPRNSGIDDITSHWSSDGSYVFYIDVKENDTGNLEGFTRVWDVTSNKEKAVIPNVKCLGPGPADNLMIMVSTENNISGSNLRLYDIKTGGLSSFGDGEIKGIYAWKNRIAYVKTENGAGTIYVADLKEIENNKP